MSSSRKEHRISNQTDLVSNQVVGVEWGEWPEERRHWAGSALGAAAAEKSGNLELQARPFLQRGVPGTGGQPLLAGV